MGNQDLTRGYDNNNRDMGRTVTPYDYGDRNVDNYNRNGMNNFTYGQDNYRQNGFRANANRDADTMADLAANVNGVDDATVVIAGGNAYVGLDLDDKVQRNEAERVERNVYNALNRYVNRYNVTITSDADMFGRLRDIGDGIRDGAPLDRYQNDFRTFDNRFRTFTR